MTQLSNKASAWLGAVLLVALIAGPTACRGQSPDAAAEAADATPRRVLVYTRTAGFRHGSIAAGVTAIQEIGADEGYDVVHTEDPAAFTDEGLAPFDVVVFLNTTGDVLDDEQQAAFERFIRGGKGFVGVHAATDTEYDWPWFTGLVGGQFAGHPKVQPATLRVTDPDHPSTAHLDATWNRTDEWYNFKNMHDGLTVLLDLDETSYQGGTMSDAHPAAWCHEYDGGRAWYTAGGHTDDSYTEPAFRRHLAGGLRWVLADDDAP